jgi:uncharacterized lipoprotein YmbA
MKKHMLIAVLLLAPCSIAAIPAPASQLQDSAPATQPAPAAPVAQAAPVTAWPTPEKVVAILDTKLALTDSQKSELVPIIAERQQKLKALAADTSGRPRRRVRKAEEILKDSDKKIKKVLSPEQQEKYAAMEQQMREQLMERMQEAKSGGAE